MEQQTTAPQFTKSSWVVLGYGFSEFNRGDSGGDSGDSGDSDTGDSEVGDFDSSDDDQGNTDQLTPADVFWNEMWCQHLLIRSTRSWVVHYTLVQLVSDIEGGRAFFRELEV